MKKKVWIFNHYATDTMLDHGGRHYWFAKYLTRAGYDVRIFCASTVHDTDINFDVHKILTKSYKTIFVYKINKK